MYDLLSVLLLGFCFQAEDGIRDRNVTGVQTCALPISAVNFLNAMKNAGMDVSKINVNYSIDFASLSGSFIGGIGDYVNLFEPTRSEERRVGKKCRRRGER